MHIFLAFLIFLLEKFSPCGTTCSGSGLFKKGLIVNDLSSFKSVLDLFSSLSQVCEGSTDMTDKLVIVC